MHVSLHWPFHALVPPPPPIYVDPSMIEQLTCFEEGEGDNVYYSFQCMSWNETCVLTFSTNCLSKDCRPSCTYQKLTLSYHINCLWQIVWSRGWLCLLELRNEKEEHLKHQQACSWSRWVDLGMSLEEGMDLELQRPSPHRALLYKETFKTELRTS